MAGISIWPLLRKEDRSRDMDLRTIQGTWSVKPWRWMYCLEQVQPRCGLASTRGKHQVQMKGDGCKTYYEHKISLSFKAGDF